MFNSGYYYITNAVPCYFPAVYFCRGMFIVHTDLNMIYNVWLRDTTFLLYHSFDKAGRSPFHFNLCYDLSYTLWVVFMCYTLCDTYLFFVFWVNSLYVYMYRYV